MTITWEEYVEPPLGSATKNDIYNIEQKLGLQLPSDYKSLIIDKQGTIPSKEMIESQSLNSVPFGPLFHISEDCTDEQLLYSALEKFDKWKEFYTNIFPIADSAGTGCFFAYNYNIDKENPSIIFVNVEEEPDTPDSFIYVAANIKELISSLTD